MTLRDLLRRLAPRKRVEANLQTKKVPSEDREQVEKEKKQYADELHDARARLHYLQVRAAVEARRTEQENENPS